MEGLGITDVAAGVALGNLMTAAWVWAGVRIHKTDRLGFWTGVAVGGPAVFVLAALATAS